MNTYANRLEIKKQKQRNINYNNGKNYNSFFYRLRNKTKVFSNQIFFVSELCVHKYNQTYHK